MGIRMVVVDSWEDVFFSDFMREVQFYVVCIFKFFVDNFVYFRIGIDKCRRDNGQVVVFFYVMCCIKEVFRTMQGVGIYIIG